MARIKRKRPRRTPPDTWCVLVMEARVGDMPPFGKWPDKYTRLSSYAPYYSPIEDIHNVALNLVTGLLLEHKVMKIPKIHRGFYDQRWMRDAMMKTSPDMKFSVDGIIDFLPEVLNKGNFPCLPDDAVGMSNRPDRRASRDRWFYWYRICEELYVGVSVTEWVPNKHTEFVMDNPWYRLLNAGYKKLPDPNKMTFAKDDDFAYDFAVQRKMVDVMLQADRLLERLGDVKPVT